MAIVKQADIVIAIPTNGRPYCLKDCLDSIVTNVLLECEVLILDSTEGNPSDAIKKEYQSLYARHPDISVIYRDTNTAPGKARKLLSDFVQSDKPYAKYLLFLDDDVSVYPGSIEIMKKTVDEGRCDIVSAIWEENPIRRAIGFTYSFGEDADGKYVLKSSVRWKGIASNDLIFFDEAMPSLFAKMDVFERISFDDRYDFYFDIFDFFMECRKQSITIAVHGGARFFHNPKKYRTKSMRQLQDVSVDRDKFIAKWGIRPVLVIADRGFSMKELLSKIKYKFIKPK